MQLRQTPLPCFLNTISHPGHHCRAHHLSADAHDTTSARVALLSCASRLTSILHAATTGTTAPATVAATAALAGWGPMPSPLACAYGPTVMAQCLSRVVSPGPSAAAAAVTAPSSVQRRHLHSPLIAQGLVCGTLAQLRGPRSAAHPHGWTVLHGVMPPRHEPLHAQPPHNEPTTFGTDSEPEGPNNTGKSKGGRGRDHMETAGDGPAWGQKRTGAGGWHGDSNQFQPKAGPFYAVAVGRQVTMGQW